MLAPHVKEQDPQDSISNSKSFGEDAKIVEARKFVLATHHQFVSVHAKKLSHHYKHADAPLLRLVVTLQLLAADALK